MAASASAPLSLLLASDRTSGHPSSSGLPLPSLNVQQSQVGLTTAGGWCSLRHSVAIEHAPSGYSSSRRRLQHIVGARRPGKDRNGGVAQAVEEIKIPDDAEPDDMYMGRKIEGLEPDFWEGEKWDTFGFIVQYLWAFGVVVSLVACGVAVANYNSGASDIRDTAIFQEALENQAEFDSSVESENAQDFPEVTEAPSLD